MADFKAAIGYILQNEGGYVNDPDDLGGETYRGISRKNFPNWDGWATIDSNKPLTKGELISNLDSTVNQFYKRSFWDAILADGIDSQPVAAYLFDFKVNAGYNAVKCVQRILGITVDGIFGNGTLNALNEYQGDMLAELHNARLAYYEGLNNPRFIDGWNNRANELYEVLSA